MRLDGAAVQSTEAGLRVRLGDDSLSRRHRALTMGSLAECLVMQGRIGEAAELFEDALRGLEQSRDILQVLCGYARLLVVARRSGSAAEVAAQMIGLLQDPDTADIAPWGHAWRCQLLAMLGLGKEALSAANQAVEAATVSGRGMAEALSALAQAQEMSGDLEGALGSLEEAMVHMRSGHCLMEARAEFARLAMAQGDVQAAVHSLQCAVQLPDHRDRQVLARVMAAVATLGSVDPVQAVRLVETLATHLQHLDPGGGVQ